MSERRRDRSRERSKDRDKDRGRDRDRDRGRDRDKDRGIDRDRDRGRERDRDRDRDRGIDRDRSRDGRRRDDDDSYSKRLSRSRDNTSHIDRKDRENPDPNPNNNDRKPDIKKISDHSSSSQPEGRVPPPPFGKKSRTEDYIPSDQIQWGGPKEEEDETKATDEEPVVLANFGLTGES